MLLVCMVICQGASNCYVVVYVASTNKCYLKNAIRVNNPTNGACND